MRPHGNRPLPSPGLTEPLSSPGSSRPATMINSLPGDVLLEIFDRYRIDEVTTSSTLPWNWHRLAHVCRTWRDIILSSSRHLNLELLCTHGTPVRKYLGYLPALPIVIYFPDYFSNSDEDNILAALEHPDRVHVLELSMPCSLLEKFATVMQEPFPVLKHLWLGLNRDRASIPVLPDTFLGGCAPHLQKIYLDGISFPAAPTLLLSARDLVDIELRDISLTAYISPGAMVTNMAALPKLKYLALRFPWLISYPNRLCPPPITRTVLPALTYFHFGGLFKYLEDFVAQIDAPQLDRLRIEYLDQDEDVNFQIPRLCKFIERSEKLKPSQFRHADLSIEPCTVVIELWGQLSFELSFLDEGIDQVLSQICGMLSNVDRLFIGSVNPEYDDLGGGIRWLELLHPFTAVKALRVQYELAWRVALALENIPGERVAQVLPALELLCLEDLLVTPVKKFLATRRDVGCPVTFIYEGREFQGRLKSMVDFIPPEANVGAPACGDC